MTKGDDVAVWLIVSNGVVISSPSHLTGSGVLHDHWEDTGASDARAERAEVPAPVQRLSRYRYRKPSPQPHVGHLHSSIHRCESSSQTPFSVLLWMHIKTYQSRIFALSTPPVILRVLDEDTDELNTLL